MSWSSYHQAISGAGRLSRLIKETKQRQILMDAVTNEIPDPEQLSISRSWASLSGTNDKLSGGTSRQVNDVWKLPLEPYSKMKLWLKFDSGLKLKDWSYNGNITRVKGTTIHLPEKQVVKDDAISAGEIYNVFDGSSQWAEVEHSPSISFSELLMDNDEVTLTVFMSPFDQISLDSAGYGDLFYKIDSDEVRYGYRARINIDGSLRFTVVDNYAVYNLDTPPGVVPLYDTGDFDQDDFDHDDFDAQGTTPHQEDPTVNPPDWTIYTFTYNTATRAMKICSAWVNVDNPTERSVVIEAQTTFPYTGTNLSMHLPLNEGFGTVAHDASGLNNVGTFGAGPTANPVWTAQKTLSFDKNDSTVSVANHSSIDALSVFTIAFKVKLFSYSPDASSRAFLSKNVLGSTVANSFLFSQPANGSKHVQVFWRSADNVSRSSSAFSSIVNLNEWYSVIWTYDGTNSQLTVGAVTGTATATEAGGTITHSNPIRLGATTSASVKSFDGEMADLIIDKGTAWGSTMKSWFAAQVPGNKGGFPIWQPLPPAIPEDPVPITRPTTKIYDVPQPSSPQEFKLNNPAATTPFASFYNVPGGSPVTDPFVLKYDVPDGTTGGDSQNPWANAYSLTPANSTGTLNAGELAYAQYIRDPASVIEGIKPTEITAYLKKNNASGGTVYLGIIKANGNTVKFGAGIAVSSIPTDWTSFLRAGNNVVGSQYTTVVGDAIGVIWEGASSGTLNIQRGGTGVHAESSSLSCQNKHDGTEWGTPNDDFSMAGLIRTGGETVPGSNPFYKMGTLYNSLATWQLNSVFEGIVSSKVIFRARRVGSAASATLKCTILNNSNVVQYTFPATISFNSISTTVQDLEFVFTGQTVAWADNFRICLQWAVITGINETTNYLEVNYNVGPGNAGMVGGNSIRAQAYKSTAIVGWYDVSPQGTDWAGKIYTGGNDFIPWVALNDTRKRYGEKVNSNVAPVAIGLNRKVTKATFTLRKVGDPQDNITFKIYSGTNPVAQSFSVVNAASLTTSELSYDFSWVFNAYVTQLNDYLVIEYNSGTAANYIEVKINTDAAAGTAGDGQKMIAVEYVNNAWVTITNRDVSAIFYEGGIPDLSSRNRVSVMVVTEASQLKSDKVTEASFYFKIQGTVTGNIEMWSRRGSDDTSRDLIGTVPVSGLNSTTWQKKTVINRNAVHFLGVSDKISIEYSGGDTSNYVRVMMNPADVFDGDNTQISEYNSVTWSTPVDNLEIVGELWTGGDTYTPDPGTPFIMPPAAYSHNLLIAAGGVLSGGATGSPLSFAGMRCRDFRIVAGDPSYNALTSLENWILNRHTILPILKGQVALGAFATLTA